MLPPGLDTPRQVKAYYDARYASLIASGDYQPFLYPWATLGAGLVLLYLLFDHRKSPTLQAIRLPLYGLLCAFSSLCILTIRARSAPAAYGVGLLSSFGTLWCGAIMCFNDCQTQFKRIDRADNEGHMRSQKSHNDSVSQNGTASKPVSSQTSRTEGRSSNVSNESTGRYIWQSYPSGPFIARLDWVVDIFCSFRGIGWTFHTAGLPPAPGFVQADLDKTECKPVEQDFLTDDRTGTRRFLDRTALLKHVLVRLIIGYFALDLIKTIMHNDAYFWGYMDAPPPLFLPDYIRTSYPLVKSYRLLVSLAGIMVALSEIFWLGPLFFCGVLDSSILGVRSEPWMNPPDFFGNLKPVLNQGLSGWWGGFWHQTFRFAFEAPTMSLLDSLQIDKKTKSGRTIALFSAFFLSGCLHFCGSYTQLGDTRPFLGPMMFFLWQAVGIFGQTLLSEQLKKAGIVAKTPKLIRQLTNLAFTIVWLYFTAPLLADDFAKGGVWLYEPVAFSPLRWLGYGAKDDNGWDLWYGLVWWRSGKHWWDTGIAF